MLNHFLRDAIVQNGFRARGLKEKELQFDFYIKICPKMIKSYQLAPSKNFPRGAKIFGRGPKFSDGGQNFWMVHVKYLMSVF